jgi:O-6-methylguanine DNA methyltransferase
MNLSDYTYYLVRQIPKGRVSTYGAVAEALGNKNYARVVGTYMHRNPDADTMPCFKIVNSDGSLGGFGLGIPNKIRRLQNDGIKVKNGKIIDFDRVFFNDFKTEYPLKKKKS